MALTTLDQKFVHELSDIYDAEHRFRDAQQKMMQQADDSTLKQMISEHIDQTKVQITNLEQIFKLLNENARRETCDSATGLVSEGEKGMKAAADAPAIRDCLIASAVSKVEHYEIASYRGLIQGAEQMDQKEIVNLLKENLKQEEQTAKLVESSTPTLLRKAIKAQEAGR
jgi:ferritin-like metal-binding protein YciE